MLFDGRAVIDNIFFRVGQLAKRHVGAHAHLAADIGHQRPHQRVPGGDRALVNAQRFIRHQRGAVHRAHDAGAAAGAAGALAVEGELFSAGGDEACAAHRADQLLPGCNGQVRRVIMPVRAAVGRQAGEHQPQTVQQLGAGAKRAADTRHTGALVQGQRGRNIQHLVHIRAGRLGHAPPRIGGKRLQIAAGPFGIQYAERQRRFARPGHPGDADDAVQRDIDVDVFQVVHTRAAHPDGLRFCSGGKLFLGRVHEKDLAYMFDATRVLDLSAFIIAQPGGVRPCVQRLDKAPYRAYNQRKWQKAAVESSKKQFVAFFQNFLLTSPRNLCILVRQPFEVKYAI